MPRWTMTEHAAAISTINNTRKSPTSCPDYGLAPKNLTANKSTSTITVEVEEFLTSSYGIFSGIAQHLALLEFSQARAKWVADESWHPKQQGQWLENGNYQISIPFNDSRELIMDILKHGAEVEVIAPEFLREAVIKQIAAMQIIYKI